MRGSAAITGAGLKPSALRVLDLLQERGDAGLSALEALHDGGGLRLSGRILELRQHGIPVETDWETGPGGVRYARYRLVAPAEQLRMAI